MKREMANRFDILDQPHYYNGAMALSGAESDSFLRRYLFDLSPTTDDRPYFSHFFRWDKAAELFKMLRREGLPLIDMGYIFVTATLLQALCRERPVDNHAPLRLEMASEKRVRAEGKKFFCDLHLLRIYRSRLHVH